MFFSTFHEAWVMGGHGAFVWSAVGISVIACLWLACREVIAQRQCIRREQRRQRINAAVVKE